MEVEFLSNMRYELYVSDKQWRDWKAKLARLGSFYDKAVKQDLTKKTSPVTTTTQYMLAKIPSPPSMSRHNNLWQSLPNPMHTVPRMPQSPAKSYNSHDYPYERKRSLDVSLDMPPAKRAHHTASSVTQRPLSLTPHSIRTPGSLSSIGSYDAQQTSQLPIAISTIQQARPTNQLAPLSMTGNHAMSTVYTSNNAYQPPITPISQMPPSLSATQTPNFPYPNSHDRMPSLPGSARTSPTNMYGTTTPTRLSPSYFLMHRDSPYRPVRQVNTLLHPPPHAAMQASAKNIP
ncbi:hypothetical protein LTR66_017618, partial [Elasticomyces elasticus]